jgi:hypothetical protein
MHESSEQNGCLICTMPKHISGESSASSVTLDPVLMLAAFNKEVPVLTSSRDWSESRDFVISRAVWSDAYEDSPGSVCEPQL